MPLIRNAIELTILGMGVVFFSLIALMYVIRILNRFFSENPAEEAPAAIPGPAEGEGDLPLVLAAAAGYFIETEGADVFIPEVRRGGATGWARSARSGRVFSRRRG
ncbi:MAG: OadG family protein [Nitrospinota bacterium]|nr:OadG family protein [Nitrospinota bacterium]